MASATSHNEPGRWQQVGLMIVRRPTLLGFAVAAGATLGGWIPFAAGALTGGCAISYLEVRRNVKNAGIAEDQPAALKFASSEEFFADVSRRGVVRARFHIQDAGIVHVERTDDGKLIDVTAGVIRVDELDSDGAVIGSDSSDNADVFTVPAPLELLGGEDGERFEDLVGEAADVNDPVSFVLDMDVDGTVLGVAVFTRGRSAAIGAQR